MSTRHGAALIVIRGVTADAYRAEDFAAGITNEHTAWHRDYITASQIAESVEEGRQLGCTARQFTPVSRSLAFANASFEPAAANRGLNVTASDYVLAVVMPQVQRRRLLDVAPGIRLSLNTLTFHSGQADRLVSEALERNNSDFVILRTADP